MALWSFLTHYPSFKGGLRPLFRKDYFERKQGWRCLLDMHRVLLQRLGEASARHSWPRIRVNTTLVEIPSLSNLVPSIAM